MKTLSRIALMAVFAALVAVAPAAEAGTWNIDTNHSNLNFKVRHLFTQVGGTFDSWEGTIEFDPENPEEGSVEIVIQTASINTQNDDRDGHLKSPDFFDAENHPTITFKSTKIEKVDDKFHVTGDLTMHGVTKSITIPVAFVGSGPHPMADATVAGFSGSVEINRKDWGIEWNRVLDAGGTLLGEDVTITLEIEAVQPNA